MPEAAYDLVRDADTVRAAVTANLERAEDDYEAGVATTHPGEFRESIDLAPLAECDLNLTLHADMAVVPTKAG